MRRMGEPDEIGKVVLFLASDMASHLTGSQVVVDGGALRSEGQAVGQDGERGAVPQRVSFPDAAGPKSAENSAKPACRSLCGGLGPGKVTSRPAATAPTLRH